MGQSYGYLVYHVRYRPDSDVWDNRRISGDRFYIYRFSGGKDGYGADDLSSGHGYQFYHGSLRQSYEKEDQKVPVLCEDTERETLRNH